MPTFVYEKLVRNNIPSFHDEAGHKSTVKKLEGSELTSALTAKLHEEADEVNAALTQDELIEELADVQQVIEDLCLTNNIPKEQLLEVMTKKSERKGGFSEGYYIETVTMPNEDDKWVTYCRNAPDKYPEIK
ncbi:nucleoside triphosphate pyrophosphohydrolase [Candidatus Saccharibacteria bacterium TM7i]|nr:nucleoside triphosphate pyrophosphohydrolase [Candidatus Saccharibacteria bacterium TM7i]